MTAPRLIKIWDPLVRICHWSFVIGFILNYFIVEPGRLAHEIIGYAMVLLVAVRIIWGFTSSNFANFCHIRISPAAIRHHLAALNTHNINPNSGHNPIGWMMVLLVFALFIGLGVTGYMLEEIDAFFGDPWIERIHEWLAHGLYGAVIVHVLGVVITQRISGVALVKPMITGKRKIN